MKVEVLKSIINVLRIALIGDLIIAYASARQTDTDIQAFLRTSLNNKLTA